uniref:TMEM198/TM7SF3 family protein n=1 Tax=Archaeoglobus fulgidus TaxID=2234 RepID=A0A7J2TIB9_ARCFL
MYDLIASLPPHLVVALIIVVGLVLCFVGYKLFKLYSAVIGFILGIIAGHYLVSYTFESFWTPLILGFVFAILFWFIYKIALFFTGAVVGYMLADAILPERLIYTIPSAVFFGILTLFIERALLIIITAFLGSTAITFGIYTLVSGEILRIALDPRALLSVAFASPLYFLLWLVLGIIGVISQIVLAREESNTKS